MKIRRYQNHTPSIYAENPITKADIRLYAINISCNPILREFLIPADYTPIMAKKTGIRASMGASDKKRKAEIEKRLSELDTLTQSVYENMVLGKVPEEVCRL